MTPLITANQLEEIINSGENVLLCDCRFDLVDPLIGKKSYEESHIPGAIYVDLDHDLSGPKTGSNGRHPLPSPEVWAKTKTRLGIAPNTLVVAYDKQGSVYASRLWWMLKSTGHANVQVLDGGLDSWNGPMGTVPRQPKPVTQAIEARPYVGLVLVDEVLANLQTKKNVVIDARANDRFHGQNETLDPVGGHIPGALNHFFKDNLSATAFKPAEQLFKEFVEFLGPIKPSEVIHQCGSGVTACHNLLAMEIAGLKGSRVYAGSWSEWSADSSRPVEL
ncbi:sulfurtransferase [Polynucleobacter asymbioticus]|uniref:3-mercaptopyruvate sulfurtransferase n=1 Tax=Polynucleobacter asymbioticus (strain DSM 18221 / CIP 109841 / QLW-P1DMWA-1) TaxID=312153 RepID=A4SZK7_POLAQ|nr:sulfurtransferase [Polynucleobacter asymbioticus]ABP34921.1 3-mercaptopyruvate sulfurtransferase [Polynucleobacter asymbioticus QLW-P1DMWA-1]